MMIDDDIDAFHVWATKLGCPPDAIPSEDALRSLFKSRQRDFFCNLMLRVRPVQEVKEIENNILINKIERIKDQVIPISERTFLPKQLQIHLTLKELNKKAKELQEQLDEYRKEYEELVTSIKIKCAQTINLENKCSTIEDRILLMEFKSEQLDKEIEKEKKNHAKILDTMPVLLTDENKSENAAMEAVKQAIQHLEEFYSKCDNSNNSNYPEEDNPVVEESMIWEKMRQTFANIPRFLIFKAIMQMKEEQLQHLLSLNKSNNLANDVHHFSSKESESKFDFNILKAKANVVHLVARYLLACQERSKLEEQFLQLYPKFENKLLEKLERFHVDINKESNQKIIREYIVQYNANNYMKAENQFIQQQLENIKGENHITGKYLANHQVLLASVKKLYNDLNLSVNRMQNEVLQMSQIKDKILYSQNLFQQRLRQPPSNSKSLLFNTNKMKNCNNLSLMGGDMFELSNEDVLCSTKLDFDTTMLMLNSSTPQIRSNDKTNLSIFMPSGQMYGVTPLHKMELKKFYETPLERFNCIPKECLFHLTANPLLLEPTEVSPTVQLAPGILLTPYGVLQEVQERIKCADLIAAHSNELKFELDILQVDEQALKKCAKEQHDNICELLDRIDATSKSSLQSLEKADKFYQFLMENPLRLYIPAEKKFNNQTYADYEAEYIMYYRMAMKDPTIT